MRKPRSPFPSFRGADAPGRIRRARALSVALAPLTLALAGCVSGPSGSTGAGWSVASGAAVATGDTRAATIDPGYALAPENRAPSPDDPLDPFTRRAAEIAMRDGEIEGAVTHLARLHANDPSDVRVAYDLARHLRYAGALSTAERVLNDSLAVDGDSALLRLELGKVKLAGGFAQEALLLFEPLKASRPNDPAVIQAVGVSLDRLGRHAEAQAAYADALTKGRPSAALLNNLGLSHLLSGELDAAVQRLREASTAPGANAQVRQNLALALTLKGDDAEAERVAQAALPNGLAEKALAYYRSIPQVRDAWSVAAGG